MSEPETVGVSLTRSEALVLFEWISKHGDAVAVDDESEVRRRYPQVVALAERDDMADALRPLTARFEALYGELDRLPLAHCFEVHLSGCALTDGRFHDHHHGDKFQSNFLTHYIFSTDHKMISRQFLITGIFWAFMGFSLWNLEQNP